jgi:cobaltochelatase CobN
MNTSNNDINYTIIVNNPNMLSIFILSDNSGTNSFNQASKSILEDYAGLIDIQIRTDNQAVTMSNQELASYLESADIVVAEWISSGVYEKLNVILKDNPHIINNKLNKIFLILEPPVSTTASSVNIIKNSTFYIKGVNRLASLNNISSELLYDYYFNTTRGLYYSDVYKYIQNHSNIPELYNRATLYKDLSSVDGYRNMLLWLLNSMNSKLYNKAYTLPPDKLNTPTYGIYREKWYSSLDDEGNWIDGYEDYTKEYINSSRPTIGIIESKMYVDSQQLQPYYAIISKLESLGLNVIPVVAYGGTNEQLQVMLKTFTNENNLEDIDSKTDIRIDAMVNMVAYGLGGTDFDKVTPFFSQLNIPILKAVHSDYVSNT